VPTATDRYTIVSSDTHAGGSHAQYREFLSPKFYDDFDAWRGEYKNPFKDLGDNRRYRNWDNEMRNGQQDEDGVVGEVIFPNTVPPFFPGFVFSRRRRRRRSTHTGSKASARTTAGSKTSATSSPNGAPASGRSSSTTSMTRSKM